jgi:hypothetical protein
MGRTAKRHGTQKLLVFKLGHEGSKQASTNLCINKSATERERTGGDAHTAGLRRFCISNDEADDGGAKKDPAAEGTGQRGQLGGEYRRSDNAI